MEHDEDVRRRMVVHLCTISGVCRRYYRVEWWLLREGHLVLFRDDVIERIKLEPRHIGAYALAYGDKQ